MKALYQQILINLNQLIQNGTIQYRNVWNNQHQRMLDGDKPEFYPFNFPAVLVEIMDPAKIVQLGIDESGKNGQLYDGITVRFHVIHQEFDSMDGDMDKNLEVFDVKGALNDLFNKWQAQGSSTFMRISETQDKDHGNLYHYIQDYITSYIEFPTTIEINNPGFDIQAQPNLS